MSQSGISDQRNVSGQVIKASILIAAYEHVDFLRRTLLAFSMQTSGDFEIIVCDDGSGPGVGQALSEFRSSFSGRVLHCRHEKNGFRKCAILNEGIIRSAANYLIFADADCIPHSAFVEQHLAFRESGCYLVGRRVQLAEELTAQLTDRWITKRRLERLWTTMLQRAIRGELRNMEEAIFLPGWRRLRRSTTVAPLQGCNFSCWKPDMFRINGFNEDFTSAGGGEDDDIERRFQNIGLRARSVRNAAICYHQYHPLVPRGPGCANKQGMRLFGV